MANTMYEMSKKILSESKNDENIQIIWKNGARKKITFIHLSEWMQERKIQNGIYRIIHGTEPKTIVITIINWTTHTWTQSEYKNNDEHIHALESTENEWEHTHTSTLALAHAHTVTVEINKKKKKNKSVEIILESRQRKII